MAILRGLSLHESGLSTDTDVFKFDLSYDQAASITSKASVPVNGRLTSGDAHFNLTIEMSLSALIRHYNIAQIPIGWRGRTWGSSNLHISEMGRRYLSVLLKLFFEQVLISDDLMAERLAQKAKRGVHVSELEGRLEELEARVKDLEQDD